VGCEDKELEIEGKCSDDGGEVAFGTDARNGSLSLSPVCWMYPAANLNISPQVTRQTDSEQESLAITQVS